MQLKELQTLLTKVQELSRETQYAVQDTNKYATADNYNNSDLADVGYVVKQLQEISEEQSKNFKAVQKLLHRLIFARVARAAALDPSGTHNLKGTLCTATPDVRTCGQVPKAGTPEYLLMMGFMGVPQNVAERGILNISFTELSNVLTKAVEEGRAIPDGIGKHFDEYNCRFVPKKFK